jgi:hypothetical protein
VLVAIGIASIGPVGAQQVKVIQVFQNVHVVGTVAHGGTGSGDDGKEHLLVGVELAKPLEGGIDRVEALVTHNEPSEKIQTSITLSAGKAKSATIDLSCPSVKVITAGGSHKLALGDDCTFNRYDGPIVSD